MNQERVLGKKADLLWAGQKVPSIRDLKLKKRAGQSYTRLVGSVSERGSNCHGRFKEFAGRDEDLPTDHEAKVMCAGCPVFAECADFLKEGNPTYGVWAGEVRRTEAEN